MDATTLRPVVVEHVTVNEGGQAIVGAVTAAKEYLGGTSGDEPTL
jgi:hypothetical protein